MRHQEGALWRSALLLLILLAVALAYLSWDTVRALPQRLEALPIGLVVLVALFGAYVWSKTRQIAELRGLVQGFDLRAAAPPSEKQLEQLVAVVSRSQQGFRDLIDTFADQLFAMSLDGEIRAANRSFAELLELPFPEIIGHKLDEFLDDPGGVKRAEAEKALPRFLERRHWSRVIRARLKKTGAVRYFNCMLHAMVKDGHVTGLSVLARDITEERESEARFTELFETLQEGVYFTTPDGKLLDVNPALVRMLGYSSKEELLGVRLQDLILETPQSDAERRGAVSPQAAPPAPDQPAPRGREITMQRKDGTSVICLNTATPIRDPAGRTLRYHGTLVDITLRREMERRLHQEQEFAHRLVDCFPDLIVVLDTSARYTFISPRITEILGYSPEELLGQSLGERTTSEDRPALLELFENLISGRQTFGSVEYRTQHKLGDWRLLRASAGPLFDAQGKIAGVIASARDVTDVKRLEQQVIQSERLAAMGQMIAGVAHELNNPLTAILGVSELLRDRATDETSRRQLDLAHRQARRAAQIVQSLLAFSHPQAPRKARLQLSEVLGRALQLHEHSLRANNISVDFVPRPDLPAVVGEANQLMQVFMNLLINAEQSIRQVRDHGTIRVRMSPAAGYVVVNFQDDGAGIPRDALPRLFDPFFTTKRPGRGTGLGLSICMAIVKEHGGNIEAQSPPGGGAVFTVWLPTEASSVAPGLSLGRAQDASTRLSPGDAPASVLPSSALLRGRSVLVVDDEESIRELVQDGLSTRGAHVDCAASAEQALDLASARAYDLVLCDLNLAGPGKQAISSKELFERLHSQPGNQQPLFIYMTGDLVDATTLQLLSGHSPEGLAGAAKVVQKPFRISELVAILEETLQTTGAGERQPRPSP